MSPLLTRIGGGRSGFGFGKKIITDIAVPITFTVEVYGSGGVVEYGNIANYPRYGYGGYNKVSITALSNQIGYVRLAGGGRKGYGSFYIDGQWIVVAGGGGEPGSNVRWRTSSGGGGFSDAYTVSGNVGGDGEGGYSLNGGGPMDAANQAYIDGVIDDTNKQWWISGGYGAGAPSRAYPQHSNSAYSLVGGLGGRGNIRCYNDSGVTSGIVGSNICTMSFVTSGTGVNNGQAKAIITNTLTGRSMTYSQSNWNDLNTTFPLSDIIAY
jgi:hypothetical protein